jgi:phage shock protein C
MPYIRVDPNETDANILRIHEIISYGGEMKKLYRSRDSKIIAGVCGGIGEYFEIDPVIVRVIFLLLIFSAVSPLAYIIAWIIIPLRPEGEVAQAPTQIDRERLNKYLPGLILILIGAAFLMARLWDWLSFGHLWPIVLIIIGGFLIYRAMTQNKEGDNAGE